MPLVVDASFAGAWILPDEKSEWADTLLEGVVEGKQELAVPDLWSYEITNLLVVACRRDRISEDQIDKALELIERLPCVFYDHNSFLARRRIARLSSRFSLSAYDAAYLELADRLQCPLHSLDQSLLEAAQTIGLR